MKGLTIPVAVAFVAASVSAQNARTPVQLDAGLGDSQAPAIVSEGELSAAVWKDIVTEQLYCSVSNDQGRTWGAAVRIDDSPGGNKFVEDVGTLISGGNIIVTWRDERLSTEDDLFATVSTDGGLTWSTDVELDKGYPSGANPVREWRAAGDGSNIAVAITPDNGNEDLYLVYSTDGGVTWSSALSVTSHNGQCDIDQPAVIVSGDTAWVAWADNFDLPTGSGSRSADVAYVSVFDFVSGTFTAQDVLLTPNVEAAGGDIDGDVTFAINGSTVIFAADVDFPAASGADELWVNVSTDGGATFGGDQQVGGYTVGTDDIDNPRVLATSTGSVLVAWEDNRSGGDEIFAALSTDGGVTFTESGPFGTGGFPELKGDGDYVAVNFTGPGFPEGSLLAVSNDGGATFGAAVDVAAGQTGDADFAELAFNSLYGNFLCMWLSDDTGVNQAYAGGLRSQSLNPIGPFTAGGTINFDGAGFGVSEAGSTMMVLISTSTGTALVPGDGRDIGLAVTPTLLTTASTPVLMATLAGDGSASTPAVTFPGSFPVGTTLSAIAIANAGGGSYGSITDVATITVQ